MCPVSRAAHGGPGPDVCATCEDGPRLSRAALLVGLGLPLHLPSGAYLDHLALICRGPAHHLCFRGLARGAWWRTTVAQLLHAVGLTWVGRSLAAFYAVVLLSAWLPSAVWLSLWAVLASGGLRLLRPRRRLQRLAVRSRPGLVSGPRPIRLCPRRSETTAPRSPGQPLLPTRPRQ